MYRIFLFATTTSQRKIIPSLSLRDIDGLVQDCSYCCLALSHRYTNTEVPGDTTSRYIYGYVIPVFESRLKDFQILPCLRKICRTVHWWELWFITRLIISHRDGQRPLTYVMYMRVVKLHISSVVTILNNELCNSNLTCLMRFAVSVEYFL